MSQTRSSSGKWVLRLAILAVVAAGAVYGIGYGLRSTAQVVLASRGKAIRSVPGTVEVKAEFDVILKSEVAGRVSKSELDVGRRVRKGDVLVTLDPGDVDLEIERIQNALAADRKKLQVGSTLRSVVLNLKDRLDEHERQMNAGTFSKADFEQERRVYLQNVQNMEIDEVNLKLTVANDETTLKAKQRERSKMTIAATTDSVITTVLAREGDLIGSNAPIATLISVGRTIEAKLSEDNFAEIQIGQRASVRFLTFGDQQYPATVTKKLPAADVTTQRFTVFLEVVLPEGKVLMPGLTGEVIITIAERAGAVVIPPRALVGDYVYVVESGRVALRKVARGYGSSSQVEIREGLQAGEAVVVEKQDNYRAGERVRTEVLEN